MEGPVAARSKGSLPRPRDHVTAPTTLYAGKSGAIRSSRVFRPTTVLVMSRDPEIREGWARHFERIGMRVMRCAGPSNTTCALDVAERCPLHDDADVAFYDQDSVTDELAVDLLTLPRLVPITFARDRLTADGDHKPIPVRLMDPRAFGAATSQR